MTTILVSDKTFSEKTFQSTFGESLQERQVVGRDGLMWPYGFYTLGKTSPYDCNIINSLNTSCRGHERNLYNICDMLGEDTAVAVSQTTLMLRDSLIAASGASAGLFTARTNKFVRAAREHQTTLTKYHEEIRVNKGPGGKNTKAYQNAKITYDFMHNNFSHEINLANRGKSAKNQSRSPLNNFERSMHIARSSRHIKKLELTSTIEAQALGQFSKKARIIAPGIIALDLGVRAYDVNNVREAGGDWERAAFVESFGFVASSFAGAGVVLAGAATFLAMTPVGWVAIIVTAAGVSLIANDMGKKFGNDIYDDVKKFMGFK